MPDTRSRAAPLSFRDPDGRLVFVDGRPLRLVGEHGASRLDAVLSSPAVGAWQADGRLIGARRIDPAEIGAEAAVAGHRGAVLEHDTVWFPSYPGEWTPGMLRHAAGLTLDLADDLLDEGLGLKDATPFNVLWRGRRPVFVDWLSIEVRDPRDALWRAEAQFIRAFLLPLAAHGVAGLGLERSFASEREGIEPAAFARLCPWPLRWMPPYLGMATLPARLSRGVGAGVKADRLVVGTPEKARFILRATLNRQRRRLARIKPNTDRDSAWSRYGPRRHYPPPALDRKRAFVVRVLEEIAPRRVIDLGCNDGLFSALAAERGASVVAVDSDTPALERVFDAALSRDLDIQPLRVDLAQPTPASGWAGSEQLSFDARTASARFDLVLALAVVHHLQAAARIPLDEIVRWLASMTRNAAVVEHVGPDDPMLADLLARRGAAVADLDAAAFNACLEREFAIVREEPQDGMDRRLLLLKKRVQPRR